MKYSNIPLLLAVINSYVAMPYWLKEMSCVLFGVNKSEELEQ